MNFIALLKVSFNEIILRKKSFYVSTLMQHFKDNFEFITTSALRPRSITSHYLDGERNENRGIQSAHYVIFLTTHICMCRKQKKE